jgi:hypothetical protein
MRAVEPGASLAEARSERRCDDLLDGALSPPSNGAFDHRVSLLRVGIWVAAALALCAGLTAARARGEPVLTVVRGAEPDGSESLGRDVAVLWHAAAAYDGASMAVRRVADPWERLRALRAGRAQFAIVDAAAFSALRPEFPDVVVLSALMPLTIHAFQRGAEAASLRTVPGTIVYTAAARFAAESLKNAVAPAEPAAQGAAQLPSVAAPVPRILGPLAALDLLKRGARDTLVLVAAPLGTQEISTLLKDDATVRLVSLSASLQGAVLQDRPWALRVQIPRGTYPNQGAAVDTVAQHLLLLTLPTLTVDDARRMLDCLYARRDLVAGYNPLFAAVDRRANADYAKWAPYHSVAVKEFGLSQ